MKLKSILFFGIAVLAFVGCTQDYDEILQPIVPENTFEINLEGTISQEYVTRVNNGGFCSGDQIGLYGVNYTNDNATQGTLINSGNQVDNARYTYDENSGKWTSSGSIYYKDANTNIDLFAYYPYASPSSVTEYAFEVAQDQSGNGVTDGYAMSDFLWAMAENVKPSENAVKLRFTHRLSCAYVMLAEGSGFAEGEFEQLNKTVLVMNTTRTANINLATGVATATGKAASEGIVMMNENEGFRAIVVPQTVKATTALFSITINGVVYRFKKDSDFVYEPGKQSNFTITINKKETSGEYEFVLTDCEIVDWIADLTTHGGEARQYYVVEQEEPGTLGRLLREAKKNPDKIKNLKISGKIDANDFFFMRDSMDILQAINLKECEIMPAQVGSYDEWGNYVTCSAYEIPAYAFNGKSSLVFFVFPEYVTKIGGHAFDGTTLSGALIIPDDVTEIKWAAFAGTNISSLQLPTNIKKLGNNVFYGCSSLSGSLSLPESLETIGEQCFYCCSMLSGNLVLPSKLKSIPIFAFYNCGFTGDLIIPEGVTEIGVEAFGGCKFNGQLKLPTSLKKMGGDSFGGCKFQGELVIPAQVKSIPESCFQGNEFSSIIFEEGSELVKIEGGAFRDNWRLSEPLVFPEGLMTIGASAFQGCGTLPSVVIPSTVTTIAASAFSGCYYITSLQCDATTPPVVGSGAFDGVPKDNFTLQVPESSVSLYQTANGWSDFKRIAANHDFSISRKHIRTLNTEYSKTYLLRAPSGEPWSIESCPSWVTVTPQSGVGRCEVTVTVDGMAASEVGTFTREEMDTYGGYTTETHNGRSGEIVFLLDNKDARTTMAVEQYDCELNDGEVIVNQKATKGAGVNVVFMGDCFDARDIAMGSYKSGIDEAIGYYFGIEPYKSYKDYFNVYTVVGMSDDSGMGTVNTIKDAKFGSKYSLEGIEPNTQATYEYAMKAETVNEENINKTLVVMVENTTDYGGICYMWGDGSAIAVCPMSRDAYPFDYRGIVQHEAGGHGFAKLGDEYIYVNAFISSCGCGNLAKFYAGKALGWYRNLSDNGDHNTVEWMHLFANPDYSNIVDMYEGGYFHTRGIFRSEANSCMNNNVPYYSAISRQEMVERIMRYAGLEFSLNDFYENDVRDASNNDFTTRSLVVEDNFVTRAAASKQRPPKYMGDKPKLKK